MLWLSVTPGALAEPAQTELQVSVAEILNYGVFVTEYTAGRKGFSDKAVAADTVFGVKFTEQTTTIPAELGLNFGFEYSLNTTPKGKSIPVRSVIRFPEPGLSQPGGKTYHKSVEKKIIRIGHGSLHGYGFDEPWEMIPGQWQFEIWHGDVRLIRKTFTVVSAADDA